MKKTILTVIITAVICISISVFATTLLTADEIVYVDSSNQKITVNEALNYLYTNVNETSDVVENITTNGQQTLDKYYKNLNVNVSSVPTRSSSQIPAGVTEVKAIVVRCTDWTNYTELTVTGSIVKSKTTTHLDDKLQSGKYHVYIDEMTIKTTGVAGTITITGSGGSGNNVLYYYLYY